MKIRMEIMKARGHIGSELVNKETTVISLNFNNANNNIVTLNVLNNRLAEKQKERLIKRDEKTGLLTFSDIQEIEELTTKNKIKLS